jgi:hypothetical protein
MTLLLELEAQLLAGEQTELQLLRAPAWIQTARTAQHCLASTYLHEAILL